MVWSGEFYIPNTIHIEATYLRLNPEKKNLVVVELVMGLYRQYHIFGARKCSHHDPELIPKNQLNNPINPVQWVNENIIPEWTDQKRSMTFHIPYLLPGTIDKWDNIYITMVIYLL